MPKHKQKPNQPTERLTLTHSVYEQIKEAIGSRYAEHGGVLGGDRATGVVSHFHFDNTARRTGATYSPNDKLLNRLFAEEWNPAGINLVGFVHSHPTGFRQPSGGDIVYAQEILRHIPDLSQLLLPIVMTEPDTGQFEILAYTARRTGEDMTIVPLHLEIVADVQDIASPPQAEMIAMPTATHSNSELYAETFQRVATAYDLAHLARSRVIYVGVGGAAAFVEDLARAGLGTHILIDPDTVSASNIATQQVYRKDIGRSKVECLGERILDINPRATVITRQQRLEEIDDTAFAELLGSPDTNGRPGGTTLLCGLTDNFPAQARVNRLALQFGLPSLCAQVYREGRAAEITFTYPGVTPACHRCILNSRYRAFLEQDFQNDVTSDGTPIFATTRLNALKGFLALALLHYHILEQRTAQDPPAHPVQKRWGDLLERIGKRNLVQIRMDPDIAATLGLGIFDRVLAGAERERLLFDDVVWLPQAADNPASGFPTCPDCGGTGDLRQAIGTFSDTLLMR